MIRFGRRGVALMGAAVLTGVMVGVVPGASASAAPRALAAAGTPFGQAGFVAYGTGSELDLSALKTSTSNLLNANQAFSGITAAGGTVGTSAVTSPITGAVVQPAGIPSGTNATARGSGLEVGVGLTTAQADQIQTGIAESHSAPPAQDGTPGGPAVSTVPLNIPPLITTGLLHGFAATSYNNEFCPVGQSIAYGLGAVTASTAVLGTTVAAPPVAESLTRADLVANVDGSFGLQTTVAETIAPVIVTLIPATALIGATSITITVQGTSPSNPIELIASTDGEGHTSLRLVNGDPSVTVAITLAGVALAPISVSLSGLSTLIDSLTGPTGSLHTVLAAAGVGLTLTVGNGTLSTVTSPIPTFTNSTDAISGAYDLIALNLTLGGTTVADLRVGHMEADASLPSGSIACTVPIAKNADPTSVTAGSAFTWSISVPSSSTALSDASCSLTDIAVTDKISVNSGNPTFTIGAISDGGVYDPTTKTVTWTDIGDYHPGDQPIVLTVAVSTSSGSAAGVLQDTASATAGLGDCTGGATGDATLIGPNVGDVVVTGSITLVAPSITTAPGTGLPITGTGPTLAWVAAGLLITAEGTRRILRKARSNP